MKLATPPAEQVRALMPPNVERSPETVASVVGVSWRRAVAKGAVWAPAPMLALMSALVAGAAQLDPRNSDRLLAVFPPWWSQAQAIDAASRAGAVVGVSKSGFAIGIVNAPGATAALSAQGALLVADGRVFPACLRPSLRDQRP